MSNPNTPGGPNYAGSANMANMQAPRPSSVASSGLSMNIPSPQTTMARAEEFRGQQTGAFQIQQAHPVPLQIPANLGYGPAGNQQQSGTLPAAGVPYSSVPQPGPQFSGAQPIQSQPATPSFSNVPSANYGQPNTPLNSMMQPQGWQPMGQPIAQQAPATPAPMMPLQGSVGWNQTQFHNYGIPIEMSPSPMQGVSRMNTPIVGQDGQNFVMPNQLQTWSPSPAGPSHTPQYYPQTQAAQSFVQPTAFNSHTANPQQLLYQPVGPSQGQFVQPEQLQATAPIPGANNQQAGALLTEQNLHLQQQQFQQQGQQSGGNGNVPGQHNGPDQHNIGMQQPPPANNDSPAEPVHIPQLLLNLHTALFISGATFSQAIFFLMNDYLDVFGHIWTRNHDWMGALLSSGSVGSPIRQPRVINWLSDVIERITHMHVDAEGRLIAEEPADAYGSAGPSQPAPAEAERDEFDWALEGLGDLEGPDGDAKPLADNDIADIFMAGNDMAGNDMAGNDMAGNDMADKDMVENALNSSQPVVGGDQAASEGGESPFHIPSEINDLLEAMNEPVVEELPLHFPVPQRGSPGPAQTLEEQLALDNPGDQVLEQYSPDHVPGMEDNAPALEQQNIPMEGSFADFGDIEEIDRILHDVAEEQQQQQQIPGAQSEGSMEPIQQPDINQQPAINQQPGVSQPPVQQDQTKKRPPGRPRKYQQQEPQPVVKRKPFRRHVVDRIPMPMLLRGNPNITSVWYGWYENPRPLQEELVRDLDPTIIITRINVVGGRGDCIPIYNPKTGNYTCNICSAVFSNFDDWSVHSFAYRGWIQCPWSHITGKHKCNFHTTQVNREGKTLGPPGGKLWSTNRWDRFKEHMTNRHPMVPINYPNWHPTIEAIYLRHMHNGARPTPAKGNRSGKANKDGDDEETPRLEFTLPQGPPPPERPVIDHRVHGQMYPEPHAMTGNQMGYLGTKLHRGQKRPLPAGAQYVPQNKAFDSNAQRVELALPQIKRLPGTFLPAIALPADHDQMTDPNNNIWVANGPAGTGLGLKLYQAQTRPQEIVYIPRSKPAPGKVEEKEDGDEEGSDGDGADDGEDPSIQDPAAAPAATPRGTRQPNTRKRKDRLPEDPPPDANVASTGRRPVRTRTTVNYNLDNIADAAFGGHNAGDAPPIEYESDSDEYADNKEAYLRWRERKKAEREKQAPRKRQKMSDDRNHEDASSVQGGSMGDIQMHSSAQPTAQPGGNQILPQQQYIYQGQPAYNPQVNQGFAQPTNQQQWVQPGQQQYMQTGPAPYNPQFQQNQPLQYGQQMAGVNNGNQWAAGAQTGPSQPQQASGYYAPVYTQGTPQQGQAGSAFQANLFAQPGAVQQGNFGMPPQQAGAMAGQTGQQSQNQSIEEKVWTQLGGFQGPL